MKTTTKTVELVTVQADDNMVLCDGYTKTSIGGKITASADVDLSMWQEMTDADADALIELNQPEEVS